MNSKFQCRNCNCVFESEGKRVEWQDAVVGECFKYTAECPDCGCDCNEYRSPKSANAAIPEPAGGCGSGCCCHQN
ncbi:MAG: hypothetical protein NTW49_14135 [Bacteroidia bacterium]|nr:hypothetical protein [Bacteroidia bacterium]